MRIDQMSIAAGVVGVTCGLFVVGFLANIYGQLHSSGVYIPPDSFIHIITLVLSTSVGVLTWGSVANARKELEKKENGQIEKGNYPTEPDGDAGAKC